MHEEEPHQLHWHISTLTFWLGALSTLDVKWHRLWCECKLLQPHRMNDLEATAIFGHGPSCFLVSVVFRWIQSILKCTVTPRCLKKKKSILKSTFRCYIFYGAFLLHVFNSAFYSHTKMILILISNMGCWGKVNKSLVLQGNQSIWDHP